MAGFLRFQRMSLWSLCVALVILNVAELSASCNSSHHTVQDGSVCDLTGVCPAGGEFMSDNTCFNWWVIGCTGTCSRCTGAGTGGAGFCSVAEGSCAVYSPTCPVPCGFKVTYSCGGAGCTCPVFGGTPTTTPCNLTECFL